MCQHTRGDEELCMGGNEDEACLVQGKCRHGIGCTTVSLSNRNTEDADNVDEMSLVFACEKSELAMVHLVSSVGAALKTVTRIDLVMARRTLPFMPKLVLAMSP